ncbi:MAG: PorT family protein [Muribaculaceae bacterium]|nr:PorT family protein [Muribaculaceae bacterium]
MNRKLKILLIGTILCCFNLNLIANDYNKVLWGLKATVDVEIPGKWRGENTSVTMYKPGAGFTIGGVSNIYLGKNFYFEPGVSFFYSQYRCDYSIGTDLVNMIKNPKIYKLGIEVPLVFGYTIDFSEKFGMDVFTGPQLRYALGGEMVIKDQEIKEEFGSTVDLWEIQRRVDCSWKIGIGFPMNQFTLSFEADLGITNLLKHEISFRENRIGLGLSYYFK